MSEIVNELLVARGDALVDVDATALSSPLQGVTDEAWSRFVRASITAPLTAVSKSNALGMFELTPRRLTDLGLVCALRRGRSPSDGRTIWVARFVPPMTAHRFLRSPRAQYNAFCVSIVDYAKVIRDGKIVRDATMSLSGALAILHRAGPSGLARWTEGARHEVTVAAYERAAGAF